MENFEKTPRFLRTANHPACPESRTLPLQQRLSSVPFGGDRLNDLFKGFKS